MYVDVFGKEYVKFTKSKTQRVNGNTSNHTVHCAKYDTFFKTQITLENIRYGIMLPGTYFYPFYFDLPLDVPPSCEWTHGNQRASISYTMKAAVHLSSVMSRNVSIESPLLVLYSNNIPSPPLPYVFKTIRVYKMCCFYKGDCHATIKLDQGEYAPGDNITITSTFRNTSSVSVSYATCTLYRTIQLRANSSQTVNCSIMEEQSFSTEDLHSELQEHLQHMILSSRNNFPTMSRTLFTCTYSMRIKYTLSSTSNSVKVDLPVRIVPRNCLPEVIIECIPIQFEESCSNVVTPSAPKLAL